MNEELLKAASVPEQDWPYCYISDTGMIFTPTRGQEGQGDVVKTGEQAYQDWHDGQNSAAAIQAKKSTEIKQFCERSIISGFDADVLGRGPLHYPLPQAKQDDLKVLYAQVQAGAQVVLWHDDSRVMHELYTVGQFTALYQQGMAHIISCKIRSDGLEQYICDLLAAGEIDAAMAVGWDTTLPEGLQATVEQQIRLMLGE